MPGQPNLAAKPGRVMGRDQPSLGRKVWAQGGYRSLGYSPDAWWKLHYSDDRTWAPFSWRLMESREVALVTLPDLCCHRGLCSAPDSRLEPCSLNQVQPGGACNGAHHASKCTYISCRRRKLGLRWGAPCYSAPEATSIHSAPQL